MRGCTSNSKCKDRNGKDSMEVLVGRRKKISKFLLGRGGARQCKGGGGGPYAFCLLVWFMQCMLDSRFQYMHLE